MPTVGVVLIRISLSNLCVLCVSVVLEMLDTTTTETQRTQSRFNLRHQPTGAGAANGCH